MLCDDMVHHVRRVRVRVRVAIVGPFGSVLRVHRGLGVQLVRVRVFGLGLG